MRRLFVLLFLLTACASMWNSPVLLSEGDNASRYYVKRIKAKGSYFIIYATRNDSTYKIISEVADSTIVGCEVIKERRFYNLDLRILFPLDSLFGKPFAPNLGIKGIGVTNGDLIELEEESHNALYSALNLRGVFILN